MKAFDGFRGAVMASWLNSQEPKRGWFLTVPQAMKNNSFLKLISFSGQVDLL